MKKAGQKPQHKPSAKHTLGEVLQSLQDMLRIELADPQPSAESPSRPATEGNKTAVLPDKEAVLQSLRDLIGKDSRILTTAKSNMAREKDAEPESANAARPLGETPPDRVVPETDTTAEENPADEAPMISGPEIDDSPIETGEDAAETYDALLSEALEIAPSQPEKTGDSDIEMGMQDDSSSATAQDGGTTAGLELEPASADRSATGYSAEESDHVPSPAGEVETGITESKQMEINWDDIPVLNKVVAAAPTGETAAIPASTGQAEPPAREIAIRVAAALNIELRKNGGRVIDVKTIMRLQTLLQKALETRSRNMGK